MQRKIKIMSIILSILLFVIIAVFISMGRLSGFEDWVYNTSAKVMSPVLTQIMIVITKFGDAIFVSFFCLFLFFIPKIRRNYALPISMAVTISTIFNILIKNMFARERPDILRLITQDDYSFPSGHAMISMTLYSMLALLAYKNIKNKKLKYLIIGISIMMVILISFSRIYLGVHYVTDILGGWCLGFLITFGIYHYWNRNIKRED